MIKTHILALLIVLALPSTAIAQNTTPVEEDVLLPRVSTVQGDESSSIGLLVASITATAIATGGLSFLMYKHRAMGYQEEQELIAMPQAGTIVKTKTHRGLINQDASDMTASNKRPVSVKNHENKFL